MVSKTENEGAAPDWPIASPPHPSPLFMILRESGVAARAGADIDVTPWPEELFVGVDLPASAEARNLPPSSALPRMPPGPPTDALESVAWPDELFH